MDVNKLKKKCIDAKISCLKLCIDAGQGHVTSAFSCAEIVTALYYAIMNINPRDPKWTDRDRFIMSKNHASIITYPILKDLGFFDSEIDFMKNGSLFGAHSKMGIPGVDFSGGSLGIGLGVACGLAYAAKMKNASYKIYALIGDGECYEGAIWESLMFAGRNCLDNLVIFLDRNKMTVSDYTYNMLDLEPLEEKIHAFNWDVKSINGHDMKQILSAAERKTTNKKPLCIICDTVKGYGISCMSNKLYKHGFAPKGEDAVAALRELEMEREKIEYEMGIC